MLATKFETNSFLQIILTLIRFRKYASVEISVKILSAKRLPCVHCRPRVKHIFGEAYISYFFVTSISLYIYRFLEILSVYTG